MGTSVQLTIPGPTASQSLEIGGKLRAPPKLANQTRPAPAWPAGGSIDPAPSLRQLSSQGAVDRAPASSHMPTRPARGHPNLIDRLRDTHLLHGFTHTDPRACGPTHRQTHHLAPTRQVSERGASGAGDLAFQRALCTRPTAPRWIHGRGLDRRGGWVEQPGHRPHTGTTAL